MSIRIVAISDTHGLHRSVTIPDGDILVVSGDITAHGKITELQEINDYLGALPHRYKIVIAGNHDFCFEKNPLECERILANCIYLQDRAAAIEGITIYGSPWQPWFYDWAFNLRRGPEIRAKWDQIPEATDILVTHGPPAGFGDLTADGKSAGCRDLLEVVEKIRPRFHVFGHIHEAIGTWSNGSTTFVNASICDLSYRPINKPVVMDWN